MMYSGGEGVEEDWEASNNWYRRAAEQGHPRGQSQLGLIYAIGMGVPQDSITGYMWLELARINGDQNAKAAITSVAERMTADEIERAKERAQECLEKEYENC